MANPTTTTEAEARRRWAADEEEEGGRWGLVDEAITGDEPWLTPEMRAHFEDVAARIDSGEIQMLDGESIIKRSLERLRAAGVDVK